MSSLLDDLVTVSKYIDPSLAVPVSGVEKVVSAIIYHLEHGDSLVKVVHDGVAAGKADAEVVADVQHLVQPAPVQSSAASSSSEAPAPASSETETPVPSAPAPSDPLASIPSEQLEAELASRGVHVATSQPLAPEVPH